MRERHWEDPEIQRKLEQLRARGYNFDPAELGSPGWRVDDLRRALPGGSWEAARRLMAGYEFADRSVVHAFYDPAEPLANRTMLLELRFHGLLRFDAGTRVCDVYDEERELDGRRGRVWGWAYCTLEGHLEQGQMDWQVWKWPDTGEVEFRIHARSRRAPDPNPVVRLGFRLFGRREQLAFLHSTLDRMQRLTELALQEAEPEAVREAADELTVRGGFSTDAAHEQLASRAARGSRR